MARARNIKPAICLNDALAELAHWVRLLFVFLWMLADKAGRLVDNPRRIGAALFPYEPELPIDDGLQQLHEAGFIRRYEAAGRRCIQIVNWARHQRPHHQEPDSELPPFDSGSASDAQPSDFALPSEVLRTNDRTTSDENPKSRHQATPGGAGVVRTKNRTASDNLRTTSDAIRLIPDTGYLIPDRSHSDSGESATGLDEFLAAYPKRTKRDAAARAYVSVIESPEEHERLMAGLRRWLESRQWVRSLENDGGRFVPDPDRFIFERRYLDEPTPHTEGESGGDGDVVEQALRLMRRPDREAA
jgi:hypothetical protein